MAIEALYFDYDGVIVNSDSFNIASLTSAAEHYSIPFNASDFYKYFAGRRLTDGVAAYLDANGSHVDDTEFIEQKVAYDVHYLEYVVPYESVVTDIVALSDKFTLGLVSGSRRTLIDIFLDEYKLRKYFRFVVSSEDVSAGKPSPEPYKTALSRDNRNNASSAIAIEDSPSGIASAHSAGLKCIAITTTHNDKQLVDADRILNQDASLTELLLRSNPVF